MAKSTEDVVRATAPAALKDHDLAPMTGTRGVRFEKRPARTPDGREAPGLYNAWITLDNPTQYNSYTTDMVKDRGIARAFPRWGASASSAPSGWTTPG